MLVYIMVLNNWHIHMPCYLDHSVFIIDLVVFIFISIFVLLKFIFSVLVILVLQIKTICFNLFQFYFN